jgi:Fe2+ or Zn2+ uptake regulation protein
MGRRRTEERASAKERSQAPADQLGLRGLRSTRQRVAVLRLLQADRGHPTALDVHGRLLARHPNVSQKTVYAILDALVEAGLARRVPHVGGAARYEARAQRHDHAHCRVCGRLFDIAAHSDGPIRARAKLPDGFRVEVIQVTLEGRCARCAAG